MEPEIKKRKVFRPPPRRATPSIAEKKDHTLTTSINKPTVNVVAQTRVVIDPRIQMAKNHAVAQAQQDGSKANFRIFDSPFGNFLVPVVPTRGELGG